MTSARKPRQICLMADTVPEHADVMIVAEMPTLADDMEHGLFGSKGLKEIKSYYEGHGFSVYVTYALKCTKPSKELKITDKHVKPCAEAFLQREIAQIKPRHIIVLGTNAMYAATRKKGILTKRGNRHWDARLNAYVYPTLHQMQAQYNAEQREMMWADLELFLQWIKAEEEGGEGAASFDPPVRIVSSLRGLRIIQRKIREAGGIVAVDTETTGLNAYAPDAHIRTIQFCWDTDYGGVFVPLAVGDGCYYTDKHKMAHFWDEGETLEDAVAVVREILSECRCIWHNGKFDRIWLNQWGARNFGSPIEAPNTYMDTLHVAHLLNENRPLGLKKLITAELGYPTYDIPDKLTKDLDLLIPYSTKDTVASLLLAQKFMEVLSCEGNEKQRSLYFDVIRHADPMYTRMELRGWPVNEERALEAQAIIEEKIMAVQGRLHEILEEHNIPVMPRMFASPPQLQKVIFQDLRLKPNQDKKISMTESGGLSTGDDAVFHLRSHPFISALLEWRGLTKAKSTYVDPMLRAAQNRGRITTSYKLHGTVTGRTASGKEGQGKTANGMNLQNLPYTFNIRNIIKPKDGWSIVECDFSQIELRVAGEMSQDPMLLKAYADGKDIHALRGMRLAGLDEDQWAELLATDPKKAKDFRQKAKPVNFGFLYGMSANKFQMYAMTDYGVEFSMEECQAIRNGYFADHAALEPWYRRQESIAGRMGYVESLCGRRRHLPNMGLNPDQSREARAKYQDAVRQAINTPVQCFACTLKIMAAIELERELDERYAYIIGEVHDSIVIECRTEIVKDVADLALGIMRKPKLLDRLGITLNVPIDCEAKAGASLGEAKDLH